MIVKAAVKIFDMRQNKEVIIPCMRHCDAFEILKAFNYKKDIDYKEIAQGFLTEKNKFYNRVQAYDHALSEWQLNEDVLEEHRKELFSEDLW